MLVEVPIRANLNRLNIFPSEQLLDPSWMDPKVIGYFCRGHEHERFEIQRVPSSTGSGDPKGETHVQRLYIHRRPKVYPPAHGVSLTRLPMTARNPESAAKASILRLTSLVLAGMSKLARSVISVRLRKKRLAIDC